ncbi:hypothetical protein B7P43_G16911 [Cryptotermes secundus]|uniref:Very-long-chain (3R)-3-hydroxyacyl-CoA dehydratase n=1 Tax=Cryptotermes secundus TaxID=105785 RepID=A0A2J7QFN7_9NEOP|nr:hypothetical protein B7P43_G16911 [Cryptotermes secundus]
MALSPGVKRQRLKADHSPPTSAEVKKVWIYKSTPPYAFMASPTILHAATKLVPSNVLITVFQVFSRVLVVCGVLLATPTGPTSPGLPLALVAWSITEVVRYLYYALNLLGTVPYLLVWCRYTLFIALYPIGVTGELLCLYAAQAYVAQKKLWSLEMPNALNLTFSYHYFLLFIMFLYIPLFPQMYLHMFAQRRKVITDGTSKKVK